MPYPNVTAARPVIRAYNQSMSLILAMRERAVRKFTTRKGELDANNRDLLKNGEDLTIVETKTGVPIVPIEPPRLDATIEVDMDRYIADFNEIMASSGESRQSPTSGTAAR